MHAQVAHDLLDAVVGEIAVAAMKLQALVGHPAPVSVTNFLAIAQNLVASGAPWSSFHAAWRRKVRAACISISISARRNCSAWNSVSGCPKACRSRM